MDARSESRTLRLSFGYGGTKARLAPHLVPPFPPHRLYVSVFGGTGAEFTVKQPSHREVINDLDKSVHAVFAVFRDRLLCKELVWRLKNSPDSRELYLESYRKLRDHNIGLLDRAYAFLIVGNIGFMGRHPELGRSYACGPAKKRHRLLRLPQLVWRWRERMRAVEVENLDAFELIDKYDTKDTFFFLDPPYHPSVCCQNLYLHNKFDHGRFLKRLQTLHGKAMVCGYPAISYDLQLLGWRRIEFSTRKTFGHKLPRTEVVWLNYDATGEKIAQDMTLIRDFERLPA